MISFLPCFSFPHFPCFLLFSLSPTPSFPPSSFNSSIPFLSLYFLSLCPHHHPTLPPSILSSYLCLVYFSRRSGASGHSHYRVLLRLHLKHGLLLAPVGPESSPRTWVPHVPHSHTRTPLSHTYPTHTHVHLLFHLLDLQMMYSEMSSCIHSSFIHLV